MTFRPDGQQFASCGEDGPVEVWDGRTGQERATLRGHAEVVTRLAFSPDGKTLASAGLDRTIKLWQATSFGRWWSP